MAIRNHMHDKTTETVINKCPRCGLLRPLRQTRNGMHWLCCECRQVAEASDDCGWCGENTAHVLHEVGGE